MGLNSRSLFSSRSSPRSSSSMNTPSSFHCPILPFIKLYKEKNHKSLLKIYITFLNLQFGNQSAASKYLYNQSILRVYLIITFHLVILFGHPYTVKLHTVIRVFKHSNTEKDLLIEQNVIERMKYVINLEEGFDDDHEFYRA